MKRTVQLLSMQSSNSGSILSALEFLDVNVVEVSNGMRLQSGVRTVVPGVGTYSGAMDFLRKHNYDDALKDLAEDGVPIFGICLGMQVLCSEGHEGGLSPGVGLLAGSVVPLSERGGIKYNTGWRRVSFDPPRKEEEFFFSHGFFVTDSDRSQVFGTSEIGSIEVPAGLRSGSVSGVQYHPELSGLSGVQSLRGHLDLLD